MSSKTDTNENDYDTEDEESTLQQPPDEGFYREIMKNLGLAPSSGSEGSKIPDRDLLIRLIELKRIESAKEVEKLKSENLDKLDRLLIKISALNLPTEVILSLIESPSGQLESNLERIGIMPMHPPSNQIAYSDNVRGWSQVTPPQTQTQLPQQSSATVQSQIPHGYHSRTLSHPIELMPSIQKPNQTTQQQMQQKLPPPIVNAGAQQSYSPLPSLGGSQLKYHFPPPAPGPAGVSSDVSPNSSVNNRTVLYYPSRYPGQISYYNPQNIPPPIYEQASNLPNSRLGHKRSHSAMTVPEMSTFTIRRNDPNEIVNLDPAKKSGKVSFLINTPKNPPK